MKNFKNFKMIICMLLTGILIFGCTNQSTVCTTEAKTQTSGKLSISGKQNYQYAQQMLKLINQKRKKAGLSALKLDKTLTKAAITRAAELPIYVPQESPHKRPNGKLKESLDSRIYYENCAESFGEPGYTPEQIFNNWMNSPVHKKGILLSDAKSVGIACVSMGQADDSQFWVLDFSRSQAKSVEKSKRTVSFTKNITALSKHLKKSHFSINNYYMLTVGEDSKLMPEYHNSYTHSSICINPSSFKWSSSDPAIADVTQDGIVKANSAGSVNITAKLKTGTKASFSIKLEVNNPSI